VVVDERDRGAVLDALAGWAGRYRGRCCFLSVEADWREMPEGLKRWRRSKNRILLADTVVVDLTRDRDELLAAMPKNRRQDIRKYQRSGLRLERVDDEVDFGKAMEIYKEIGRRAKFNLHEDGYYLDIWREMGEHQWLGVVKNERGEVIAFQWALMAGGNGFALFAGVGEEGRRRRINAGVKWECMGILKEMGVRKYDFNGLLNRGVNDYKRAFGGEDVRLVGTWDLPLSKLYTVYGEVFPIGKKITHLVEKVR
jgi:lipid II:glycine glycyltransferase (peptidoglycan interpeptide bridge formation enzyme)